MRSNAIMGTLAQLAAQRGPKFCTQAKSRGFIFGGLPTGDQQWQAWEGPVLPQHCDARLKHTVGHRGIATDIDVGPLSQKCPLSHSEQY